MGSFDIKSIPQHAQKLYEYGMNGGVAGHLHIKNGKLVHDSSEENFLGKASSALTTGVKDGTGFATRKAAEFGMEIRNQFFKD